MKKQLKLNQAIKLITADPKIKGTELAKSLGVSRTYAYAIKAQATRMVKDYGATQEGKAITVKDLLLSAKKRIKQLETLNQYAEKDSRFTH